MSMSSDNQPTTDRQVTAEQPAVTAVPATPRTRIWQRKVPARIGRARTSTVVISCLWLLLFALNVSLPQDTYTTVTTDTGQTVRVRSSELSSVPAPTTTAPPATSDVPSPSSTDTSTATTGGPGTSSGESTGTTPRSTTSPRSTTRTTSPGSTTGRTPSTGEVPSPTAASPSSGTTAPTS